MKIYENKTVYKCEYCGKIYLVKRFAELHKDKCRKNPDRKHDCFSCQNLKNIDVYHFYDAYDGEHREIRNVLFCDKMNKAVYPFWVKNYALDYITDMKTGDELENIQMPFKCRL